MRQFILIFGFILLTGCASLESPTQEIDTKNSPCACNYEGRQLLQPTQQEKISIINESMVTV